MELMNITMSCLISTMATGNKIIILVDDNNQKMFPFTETLKCLLPVGTSCTLSLLLEDIRKLYSNDIIVLSVNNIEINNLCKQYNAQWIKKEENFLRQMYELANNCNSIAIMKAEILTSYIDMEKIVEKLNTHKSSILVRFYTQYTRSIDTVGVNINENNQIDNIYMFPRQHYVNAYYCGACVIDSDIISLLPQTNLGFHNVNCGQMPDQQFYLEETLQNAIEQKKEIHSILSETALLLELSWQIAELNKQYCSSLSVMDNNDIDESAVVDQTCTIHGFLHIGKNSVLSDGVIVEGNVWIGDNVIIEKGVILGKNCIIKNNSTLQYRCKISDSTVIGSNNRIGFNAEITGVTFDGVCAVHNCEVYGVIGRKVDIAAGVQMAILRFDDTFTTQKVNGKKYLSENTGFICLGDYCRTGVNNVFMPGVKVGSRSAIGPCVMIEQDVPENTLVLKKQEVVYKSWGSERYGW